VRRPAWRGGKAEPVRLLWTGGWDSSFRLLDVVVVQQRPVQPYHVPLRRGFAALEIAAMARIRERLAERFPEAAGLLLDLRLLEPPEREGGVLHERYLALRKLSHPRVPGGQLYWLAATAEAHGLTDLELGLHAERGAPWYDLLRRNVERQDGSFRLSAGCAIPELELFRPFLLPLLDLSKAHMEERARQGGFADLLELSWFCYTPDRRGRPCGLCPPCRGTMAQGLGRRIPAFNRLRSRLVFPVLTLLRKLRARTRAILRSRAAGAAERDP